MFAIIASPSNLGLRPSGVERLPAALERAGLAAALGARHAATVLPAAPYDATRSAETGILNGPSLRDTSRALAAAVRAILDAGDTPIVLSGDCSVLLGCLLGAKRNRLGLLFLDGHVDFYQPAASPTGEAADMDLALATGRGPAILTQLGGAEPLVRDEDVAAVGARDAEEREAAGSQDIRATGITLIELPTIRARGIEAAADEALRVVTRAGTFWCHIDADVLDDAVMPAVDYRQPGGLTPSELAQLLRRASATKRMAGLSIAIYNPALDPDGHSARVLVETITSGLQ